jgi:hypothetical protein
MENPVRGSGFQNCARADVVSNTNPRRKERRTFIIP